MEIDSKLVENDLSVNYSNDDNDGKQSAFINTCENYAIQKDYMRRKNNDYLKKYYKQLRLNKSLNICIKDLKSKLKSEILKNYKLRKTIKSNKSNCEKIISKKNHISENSKALINMLVRKKNIYDETDKTISQSLYFKSPNAYNFLRDRLGCHLPSKSSLLNWIPIKSLTPGFHDENIKLLKRMVSNMSAVEKEAAISFDEVTLSRDLKYSPTIDEVVGVQDYGNNDRKNVLGKQTCVFLVQGLTTAWSHVLSFYVSEKNISGNDLTKMLLENISVATSIGLNINVTICDQGSNNRSCYKNLNVTTDEPFFIHENKLVVGIFDGCHLIKSLRNTQLKYDLETLDGVVSFGPIRSLYTLDSNSVTKMCPKLTEAHIFPNSFQKMRVKLATQVYSRSVAVGLKTLVELDKITSSPEIATSTANFIEKIDKLFDCLNSKELFDPNLYKCALQKDNHVYIYLQEMIHYFKNISAKTKNKIYCFDGMIQTLNGILELSKNSRLNNFIYYIKLNKVTQDRLENLFAWIRSWCGPNTNPSVFEFCHILAKILSVKLIRSHSNGANCEQENEEQNISLNDLTVDKLDNRIQNEASSLNSINFDCWQDEDFEEDKQIIRVMEKINFDNIDTIDLNSMRYVCGYTSHKSLKQTNCSTCKSDMIKNDVDLKESFELKSEIFIFNKNYKSNELMNLKCPSDFFF